MDEIKVDNIEGIEKKSMNLKEKVNFIFERLNPESKDKKGIKKLKLPRGAKVSKSRAKKGWVGVCFINENRNVRGQKVKLEGGTYYTKDELLHVTDGREICWWDGKHPVVFQRYDKLNPTNLFPKEGDNNEVYGQNMVYLRMKKDQTTNKPKGKISIVMWIIILGAGYFVIKTFFPQLFGG